jgi:hypothetical protein
MSERGTKNSTCYNQNTTDIAWFLASCTAHCLYILLPYHGHSKMETPTIQPTDMTELQCHMFSADLTNSPLHNVLV